MSFLDKVPVRDCEFVKYMDNYSGQEIAIFGYGLATTNMYKLLKNRGITPQHVVVNKKFLKPDMQIDGLKVEAIEDLHASFHHKIDIIMMVQGYKPQWLAPFQDKINRILFYDVTPALNSEGGIAIKSYECLKEQEQQLENIYNKLSDTLSKDSFVAYIGQLISGEYYLSEGLVKVPAYFDESFLNFSDHEVFVDCGAYDGTDTAHFFSITREDSKAVIFEADADNCELVRKNLFGFENRYQLIQKAVWDKTGIITFAASGKPSSQIDESGSNAVQCSSIDIVSHEIKWIPTYIKMDVEGVEMMALRGAVNTIKRYKPKLAISIYHRFDDLFDVWNFIESFDLEYKYFLRKHALGHHETILYAI